MRAREATSARSAGCHTQTAANYTALQPNPLYCTFCLQPALQEGQRTAAWRVSVSSDSCPAFFNADAGDRPPEQRPAQPGHRLVHCRLPRRHAHLRFSHRVRRQLPHRRLQRLAADVRAHDADQQRRAGAGSAAAVSVYGVHEPHTAHPAPASCPVAPGRLPERAPFCYCPGRGETGLVPCHQTFHPPLTPRNVNLRGGSVHLLNCHTNAAGGFPGEGVPLAGQRSGRLWPGESATLCIYY